MPRKLLVQTPSLTSPCVWEEHCQSLGREVPAASHLNPGLRPPHPVTMGLDSEY